MSSDINISIKSSELERFNRSIDKYSRVTQRKVKAEVQRAAFNIDRKAKEILSNKDLLGTKRAVIAQIHPEIYNQGFSGRVRSSHKASGYIEYGTKPHTIRAKNAPYLHFKIGTAGSLKTGRFTKTQWVRTKQVNHPGTREEPYMRPALERETPRFIARIKKIL